MKKFVYYFEPMGKNFFIKATDLKEAKAKLKKHLVEFLIMWEKQVLKLLLQK